jgi:hypothetical protein
MYNDIYDEEALQNLEKLEKKFRCWNKKVAGIGLYV